MWKIQAMPTVLVVCPQERDLRLARSAPAFQAQLAGPDLDTEVDVDPEALLSELAAIPADGVAATKDRSALVAALLAERRGLAGPSASAVVSCQHKPTSRAIQRQVAPEATPRFAPLEGTPSFAPPWFVKPVVGRLSEEARRVDDAAALASVREAGGYREGYARIAALAGLPPEAVRGFLVEELVRGDEVTLEGYVREGHVTVIGVTDSVKYPGTNSFERFEYPSALPPERLRELESLATSLARAHRLDRCFFNVEFLVPERGPATIVEVNARIASQFAPLVEAVHGRSTYDALFALVCGDDPAWQGSAGQGVAVSYVVRTFEDALVAAVPEPVGGLEVLVRPGLRLSDQGANDTASYRLAIFTEHAATREEAVARCLERARSLPFELDRGAEARAR